MKTNVHQAGVVGTVCRVCDKTLASTLSRKRHETIVYGRVKPFQCDIFSLGFSVKISLEGHKRSVHGEQKLECSTCHGEFCYTFSLNEHKKKCAAKDPKTYVCPVCNKRFKHERSMTAHDASAHSGKKSVCEMCGQEFAYSNS